MLISSSKRVKTSHNQPPVIVQNEPSSPDQIFFDDLLCPSPELLLLHCEYNQDTNHEMNDAVANEEVITHYAPALCRELGEMMRKGEFCDLTLVTETANIPVHVCVVAASSTVIRAYLKQSPLKHLRLSNLPGLTDIQKKSLNNEHAIRNLLCEFAYFGRFKPPLVSRSQQLLEEDQDLMLFNDHEHDETMEQTVLLLAGAIGLNMQGAVNVTTHFLHSRLNVANILLVFNAAWNLGCNELEIAAERFTDANFSLVCLEQSWIDASENMIHRILCRDELCTMSGEMEVFSAIMRWGMEDFNSRFLAVEGMLSNSRIFRIQWLSGENIKELCQDDLLSRFPTVLTLLQVESERRVHGLLPEVMIPCRFFMEVNSQSKVAPLVTAGMHDSEPSSILFSSVKVLSGHEKPVCSLAVNEEWIVSGSQDFSLRVWDLSTLSLKVVLKGHTDSVSAIKFFHNQVVSGSFDRSLRLWGCKNRVWKFQGFVSEVAHEDPVTCLCKLNESSHMLLVSGTSGGEIKIWSPPTATDANAGWTLNFVVQNAHAHVLWSCCEWNNSLVTGSSDMEIHVWDKRTWQLTRRLQFHFDEVQALLVIDGELYSGSDDGVINVFKENVDRPVRSISVGKAILAFAAFDSKLVVGLGDGRILIFHSKTLVLVADLKSHESSVMALATVENRYLLSGSFDRTVRIWGK